ncbi:MAG: glycosyltransferase family protein, partial [Bacteroidia bacterium]
IFSPHVENSSTLNNIRLEKINEKKFIKTLVNSKGVISSSGFSTLSEALYLNKPLLTIPINSHFEQIYNSTIIERLGGTVLSELSLNNTYLLQNWLDNLVPIGIKNLSNSKEVVDRILIDYIKSLYEFNKAFVKTV